MCFMANWKTYLIVGGLIALVVLGLVGFFQLRSENRSLQRALEVHRANYQKERESLAETSAAIETAIDSLRQKDLRYEQDIEELRNRRVQVDIDFQNEKDRINSYTADSLERFFARRYGSPARE